MESVSAVDVVGCVVQKLQMLQIAITLGGLKRGRESGRGVRFAAASGQRTAGPRFASGALCVEKITIIRRCERYDKRVASRSCCAGTNFRA